jgi:hypothetical protein
MPRIPFPNVPQLPGVPALPRSPNFPTVARAGLGLLQGLLWRIYQVQTRWGIFDVAGNPLGNPAQFGPVADVAGVSATLSTAAVDYSKETRVSDFPLERGSFASYNKVETAAAPTVTLAFTGSEADRRSFLDAIDEACKSVELYSVVTPEVTYINYSIERYNYQRRNAKGATLLIVEISLKEIRQVSALYSQSNKGQVQAPKDVTATPQADNGKVQAQTPKTSTLKKLADKVPSLATQVGDYLQKVVN